MPLVLMNLIQQCVGPVYLQVCKVCASECPLLAHSGSITRVAECMPACLLAHMPAWEAVQGACIISTHGYPLLNVCPALCMTQVHHHVVLIVAMLVCAALASKASKNARRNKPMELGLRLFMGSRSCRSIQASHSHIRHHCGYGTSPAHGIVYKPVHCILLRGVLSAL
jgi:hypothetical protein